MCPEYSSLERQDDQWSLPDLEIFQLTALEVAAQDEELVHEYSKRHEFRLCHMNSVVREQMLEAIVEEQGIEGGWFYWYCFPGCLPDSEASGPYKSHGEALAAAREEAVS
jgi:hypothetical protein